MAYKSQVRSHHFRMEFRHLPQTKDISSRATHTLVVRFLVRMEKPTAKVQLSSATGLIAILVGVGDVAPEEEEEALVAVKEGLTIKKFGPSIGFLFGDCSHY